MRFCLWIVPVALFLTGFTSYAPCLAKDPAPKAKSSATTPVSKPDDHWQQRQKRFNEQAKKGGIDLLFLGDSITQAWEGPGKDVWKDRYAMRNSANFGIGGDQTQHVLWRLENGNLENISPKLIVLMISTNNLPDGRSTPAEAADGVKAIVVKLREELPETKILLLGVFPRGEKADDPMRPRVAEVNREIATLADWEHIHYLDIGHVFTEADGRLDKKIMPDFLHLTPEGYERWANAIETKVQELLGESSQGWHSLFDGKSFAGWEAAEIGGEPLGWEIVDGTLKIVDNGDDAMSTAQYENFDFQCEWKLSESGNSGIFYRVADYKYIILGPEYQLVDDINDGYEATDLDSTGANIDLFGPIAHKPIRPCGTWNHTRIVAEGDHVEHWLNGVRVVSYDFGTEQWKEQLADSKFARLIPFGEIKSGAFKLQNKGGSEAQFRDLIVREL